MCRFTSLRTLAYHTHKLPPPARANTPRTMVHAELLWNAAPNATHGPAATMFGLRLSDRGAYCASGSLDYLCVPTSTTCAAQCHSTTSLFSLSSLLSRRYIQQQDENLSTNHLPETTYSARSGSACSSASAFSRSSIAVVYDLIELAFKVSAQRSWLSAACRSVAMSF